MNKSVYRLMNIIIMVMLMLGGYTSVSAAQSTPPSVSMVAASVSSTTTTFKPSGDAFVHPSAPDTNFGSLTQIRVDNSPIIHSYLRFNVQGLSGSVTKATLRLYSQSVSNTGYNVYSGPDSGWDEKNINYINAPALGDLAGSVGAFGTDVWTTADITSFVTGNGTFTLAIAGKNNSSINFVSREGGANAPELVITTDSGIVIVPTASPSATTAPTKIATIDPTSTIIPPPATSTPINTVVATSIPPTVIPTNTVLPTKVATSTPSATSIPPTVTPTVPVSTGGKVWYVDNAVSTSGDGTSWARAWKAFANIQWSLVQPGETVYISGGTYNESLVIGKSGKSGNPITITKSKDIGHNGLVILDGKNTLSEGVSIRSMSYLIVSDFKLTGFASNAVYISNTSGVSVNNTNIYISSGRGIYVQNSTNVIIKNNNISTTTYSTSQTDGIYSQLNTSPRFEHNTIVISNTEPNGHDDCIQSYKDTDASFIGNTVWQNNSKTSNAQGIYATTGYGLFKYYNNVCNAGDTTSTCIAFRRLTGTGNVEMIGNTAYGAKSYSLFWITEVSDPIFKNNISYSGSTIGSGARIINWAGNPANIDYNVNYAPNSKNVYMVGSSGVTWAITRGMGWDVHGYNANPLFVDIATRNYHLQSGSPAINHGLTTSAYTTDIDGVLRNQGTAFDIGAFEFLGP